VVDPDGDADAPDGIDQLRCGLDGLGTCHVGLSGAGGTASDDHGGTSAAELDSDAAARAAGAAGNNRYASGEWPGCHGSFSALDERKRSFVYNQPCRTLEVMGLHRSTDDVLTVH
jgi:hypothetical protein